MHQQLPFLFGLIAVIILLVLLANKWKIAYPVLLVTAGLVLGFIPSLPRVHIDPDTIFFVFLPPLLFEASWSISFKELKRWWRIIGSFAFLVVLFTAISVAVFSNYLIPGFTIALGFLLGGIVSPPDAVSTNAILRFVKVPKTTSSILEGESLLNDASSLIIFRFALVAVGTGQFIWYEAAMSFAWMVVGGVGIGLLLGWLFMLAHKHLPTDAPSDIAFTLIEPYVLYWVGEQLHSSGVLAVVCGGLFLSNRRLSFLSSASRIKGYSVWESVVFILNGLVFMIIGLQLPDIVEGLAAKGIALRTAIGYGVLVTLLLIAARIISSYAALVATILFRPSVIPQRRNRRRRWMLPLLLGWTGMRGVVSLAAALAIPTTLMDGRDFPFRNLILFITFMVILLTLLLQGLTLPFLIRKTKVFDDPNEMPEEESMKQLRKELMEASLAMLREKHQSRAETNAGIRAWLMHMEQKATPDESLLNKEVRAIHLEMLEFQRAFLAKKNRETTLNEDHIRSQLYQIDLEEQKLRMM